MAKKDSFAKQFKKGAYPAQAPYPEGPFLREPSPSSQRKRKSLALGTQEQANPGMVGKNDFRKR
jgi:hypothetical protein